MRAAAVTFLFSFFFLGLFGNTDKIDSLRTASSKVDGHERARIFNEIAKLFWYNSFDSSIKYGNAAYHLALTHGSVVEEARALNNIGVAYDLRGEYGRSLNSYFQIIKMASEKELFNPIVPIEYFTKLREGNPINPSAINYDAQSKSQLQKLSSEEELQLLTILANSYMNMGIVFGRLSIFEKSLLCFRQSYEIRKIIGDKRGIAFVLHNLGTVLFKLENYRQAEESFRESLMYRTESNDVLGVANTNLALGELFVKTGQSDSAFFYLRKANASFSLLQHRKGVADTYAKMGDLLFLQNKPMEALDELRKALNILLDISDRGGMGAVYLKMGDVYLKQGELENAHKCFEMSLSISKELDLKGLTAESLLGLSLVKEKEGQIPQAFKLYKDYIKVQDWIKEEKYSTSLVESLTLFEVDKIESENSLLKKENEIKQLNFERQRLFQMLLVALFLVLLFFGIALFYMYRSMLKANRMLTALNGELETRINNRTQELREALKLAEEANQIKNSVLSNISHEIRTPLNGILGFTSLLTNEFNLSTDEGRYVREIRSSSDKLMNLLNDLIDISRTESNKLRVRFSHCNLQRMLFDVIDSFNDEIQMKGINLITNIEKIPDVNADAENINRIFSIVFSNAVKYTDKGSVSIAMSYRQEESSVEVVMTDTGIGIDPEYLPYIFEPFQQESTGLSRLYQGAGLGLALAKRLVTLMNGTIQVTSKKGAGTIVTLKFPVTLAENIQESVAAKITPRQVVRGSEPRAKKAKVLIVEPNTYTRFYLQSLLRKYVNVYVARDANEALSILDDSINYTSLFDLIIIDSAISEPWDAQAFLNEVYNRKKEYKKRPFVVQADESIELDEDHFVQMGYFMVIRKPINKKVLLNVLSNFSRQKKSF
jgi:signal transduction histidine kinase/Tfp pilus assembly protein PilF